MQLLLPRDSACSEKLPSVAGNAFALGMVRQAQGARNISDVRALPIDTDQITDTDFLAGFFMAFGC